MSQFVYEAIEVNDISVIRRIDKNGNEAWIPVESANSDYQAYLESLNDDTETE